MSTAVADRIVMRPVAELVPYARNARLHSESQIEKLCASIREFGFTNPVLIDGDNGIIAGHGRTLAAARLGMESVPCIELAHLSPEQRRAYVIADNKLALEADWDEELLALELGDLRDTAFDLSLTGFETDEISKLLLDDIRPLDRMPDLPDGEKPPFQQITFVLHKTQAEAVKAALEKAKAAGPFTGSLNENSNGNAIARICEAYLAAPVLG